MPDIGKIGETLRKTGRLELRPLCIYGTDKMPEGALQVQEVLKEGHRCLAKATLMMAMRDDIPGLYIGANALQGVCYGASCWLGYAKFSPPMTKMLSDGEDAMYLKASSLICERSLKSLGAIKPPGKYTVIKPCDTTGDEDVKAVLCFGNAEQVRNLCALAHFDRVSAFGPVMAPWGSHCSVFIAYPAGMASGAPQDTAFLGPTAPDGNDWFPPDLMSFSAPVSVASRMCKEYENSFTAKCPEMTYPITRQNLLL